jgi:hypothetical protein
MRGASKSTTVAAKEVTATAKEGSDEQSQSRKLEEIRDSEDEAESTTDEPVAKDTEAKTFIVAKKSHEYLIYDKEREMKVVKHLSSKYHKAFESRRENSLISTKNPITLDDLTNEANKPESTEAVPARTGDFYKPGDGSGRYHYFATYVGDGSKMKDDTPCIVQNVDEDSYRIWSWKQVKGLGAENHTVTYKFDKRLKKAYPSGRRQFHLPDKEGIERLKGWGLESTDFSVITTLTWRVEARKLRKRKHKTVGDRDGYEYFNSILFTIPDTTKPGAAKKKQLLLDYRKQQDYNYEGPFRCSISKLRELAGNEVADQKAIEGLQLDTEAGEGYRRYWQSRQEDLKNRRKSRVRSREWSANATQNKMEFTQLQENHEKLQESSENLQKENKDLKASLDQANKEINN